MGPPACGRAISAAPLCTATGKELGLTRGALAPLDTRTALVLQSEFVKEAPV